MEVMSGAIRLQTCIRPWETECNSQIVTEPGPVVDPRPVVDPVPNCLDNCPPPMPCPMPEMNIDVSSCKLKYHVDDCGCQAACPSYDYTDNIIPSNCATWMDGCNTCQVRNGRRGDLYIDVLFQTRNTPLLKLSYSRKYTKYRRCML